MGLKLTTRSFRCDSQWEITDLPVSLCTILSYFYGFLLLVTDNWPENGRILQTRLWFHWGEASITALSLSVCCGPGVSRKAQSNLGNSSTGCLSLSLLSLNFCPLNPENHILHLFMAVKHFTWSGKIELYIEKQVKSIDITTHTQMAKLKKNTQQNRDYLMSRCLVTQMLTFCVQPVL